MSIIVGDVRKEERNMFIEEELGRDANFFLSRRREIKK